MFDFAQYGFVSAIALFLWIPFTVWRFTATKPVKASAQSLVWGLMFLPERAVFDLPVLPPLGKQAIAAFFVWLCLKWKSPKRLKHTSTSKKYFWLFWCMCLGVFVSSYHNQETLVYGEYKIITLKPFELYDAFYNVLELFFKLWLPLTIGRALFRSEQDVIVVLKTLVKSCLFYSLFILWEIKMSPQLHNNLYGFYAHYDFSQSIRQGGYRPNVFMSHGLILAMFVYMSFASSIILKKMGVRRLYQVPMTVITWWLFIMLVLCKSMGPLMYGVLTWLLLGFSSTKTQRITAVLAMVLVLIYPTARTLEWVPTDDIIKFASDTFGSERAQSLQFRLDNEDLLLAKGIEKFWFGWGSFGRDHVYDKSSSKDLTVQDGYWIICFGQRGFFGFFATFMFLTLPILAARKLARLTGRQKALISSLVVMAMFCTINTLPNMDFPNLHVILTMGISTLINTLQFQQRKTA